MGSIAGFGHFVSWDGGCLLVGRALALTPMHSHYAIQIAFGAEWGIRFRPSEQEPWTEYGGAIIPSRQPHTMDATQVPFNAVLFVEPETREGRALVERYLQGGIAPLPDDVIEAVAPPLFSAWQEQRSAHAIGRAARNVVQALSGGIEPLVVSDERILRATAYVRSHLDQPITLDEVASEACLSPSRFRHLFVEQTGLALRPYILWRRLLLSLELLMAGESVSSAAHSSGFADAAHLSRTCRHMFGLPPSALQFAGALRPDADGDGAHPSDAAPAPHQPRVLQPLRTKA